MSNTTDMLRRAQQIDPHADTIDGLDDHDVVLVVDAGKVPAILAEFRGAYVNDEDASLTRRRVALPLGEAVDCVK